MSLHTRREFLKTSVAASAVFSTFTIAGTKASGRVLGANEVVRVAVAGIKGRGGSHISAFAGDKLGTQVTYLIDPDSRLFESRTRDVNRRGGNKPTCVQDFRMALDDKNVDVLTIAAPNHWHAPLTIFACQAGKDVYVEKPASHNVHEGRIAVEMARKHDRIVQHGTQGRSGSVGSLRGGAWPRAARSASCWSRAGLCYKRRDSGQRPRAVGQDCRHARRIGLQPVAWSGHRACRTTRTWSIIAGTGSGTLATATSATRASTKSTRRAGASRAPRCPRA